MVEAVLWDMDGTLLDSEKLWDIPLAEFVATLGAELSAATREAMVGSNMATTMRMLYAEAGLDPTPAEIAEGSDWIRRRTEEVFREGLPWRPGAREALRDVRASGVPMALVTSTERALTEVALDTLGRDLFDVTVCGDEVDGLNKPLPEPYLKAARHLGVEPARCVAVEDSPTGATAAVAAGCVVLVVPCDVPVPSGERRVFRDSLVGVDLTTLARVLHG
ncbi:HAD family phosphatase [Saccharothrix violaceirubra]|uniref:HAD superfamily hydrolase (TIGR01509 family) n=1 Tax=Saccharothrix violaceirubra TaxID=413306 RepID=A0A7W7T1P9_9PSEU|nr:HAD family phosphatase [Saccharothrix violaceirubra]MBB4964957.1 HAD superfamily hydrolase (TIGR01509 family) [Saccharothrix violaceirubra]